MNLDPDLLARIRAALGAAGNYARDVVDPTRGRGIFGFGADVVRDIQRNPVSALTVKGDQEANFMGQQLSREGHPVMGFGLQLLGAGGAAASAIPGAKAVTNVAQDVAVRAARRLAYPNEGVPFRSVAARVRGEVLEGTEGHYSALSEAGFVSTRNGDLVKGDVPMDQIDYSNPVSMDEIEFGYVDQNGAFHHVDAVQEDFGYGSSELLRSAGLLGSRKPPPRGHLPTPTQTGDRLTLTHFGRGANEDVLRVSEQGTGQPGAEAKRRANDPDNFVERTFFYGPESRHEPRFTGQPRADVDIDPGTIVRETELQPFWEQAQKELAAEGLPPRGPGLANRAEQIIKEQGFDGYESASGVVQKFSDTPLPYGATGRGVPSVGRQAENYVREAKASGLDVPEPQGPMEYLPLDEDLGQRTADVYESLPHAPDDPEVAAAYQAFKEETRAQYDYLTDQGVKFEVWDGEGQPYANSAEMIDDVRNEKHLYFFPTEAGFGDGAILDNPLLESAGVQLNGKDLVYNDLFRAVHDYFGHAKEGVSFGPRGEFNAANVHSSMFSPTARRAMLFETHGQNSWVNFGPQMRGPDGQLLREGDEGWLHMTERDYAPQKSNIMPEELMPPAARPATPEAPAVLPSGADRPLFDTSPAALERSFIEGVEQSPIDYDTVAKGKRLNAIRRRFTPERRRALHEVADQMRKEHPGAQFWYATAPLRDRFIGELGEAEGIDAFNLFIRRVAATSPRSKVIKNIIFASRNEAPMSTMEGLLRRANAGEPFGTGAPKVSSFDQNLLGNLRPTTADVHFTDVVGGPGPRPDVYGEYDRLFNILAEEAGVPTANYQATIWPAGITNYNAAPFLTQMDRAVSMAAKRMKISKEEAFRRFIRGEEALGAIVLASVVKGINNTDNDSTAPAPTGRFGVANARQRYERENRQ